MKVVIEGPDGAGKSTLIDVLSKSLVKKFSHVTILRWGGPPDAEEWRKRVRWVDRIYDEGFVIVDRHPAISELVYGRVLRNELVVPFTEIICAIQDYPGLGIVYCRPPDDALFKSVPVRKPYKDKSHVEAVLSKRKEIVAEYDYWMSQTSLFNWVLRYDWSEKSLIDIMDKIIKEGQDECERRL